MAFVVVTPSTSYDDLLKDRYISEYNPNVVGFLYHPAAHYQYAMGAFGSLFKWNHLEQFLRRKVSEEAAGPHNSLAIQWT